MTDGQRSAYRVETAAESDRTEWLALVRRVSENFPGLDMDEYAATLKKNISRGTALCVREGGRIIGILLYSPARHCLSGMAVDPDFRRRGIASALIADMLCRMPAGEVSVTTFREDDEKGKAPRALYSRLGFAPAELFTEFDYPVQRFLLRRD